MFVIGKCCGAGYCTCVTAMLGSGWESGVGLVAVGESVLSLD